MWAPSSHARAPPRVTRIRLLYRQKLFFPPLEMHPQKLHGFRLRRAPPRLVIRVPHRSRALGSRGVLEIACGGCY